MNKSQIKSRMNPKKPREFVEILRGLAQSEDLMTNKVKITICENEFIEETKNCYIAPPTFKKYSEHFIEKYSTKNLNVNKIENLDLAKKIYHPLIETADYPDSSDFSDDE